MSGLSEIIGGIMQRRQDNARQNPNPQPEPSPNPQPNDPNNKKRMEEFLKSLGKIFGNQPGYTPPGNIVMNPTGVQTGNIVNSDNVMEWLKNLPSAR
jgi:hypothetical protein